MYILGLGGSNHGFSSCLLKDGKIISMISDERITRKKYGVGLGLGLAQGFSRKYCMDTQNIEISDLERIVGNDILSPTMYFRLEDKIELINHHLAHAYSAYYPSGMKESAIMVLDGVGSKMENGYEYETKSLYYAENGRFNLVKKQCGRNIKDTDYIENSLGVFYALITEMIGFGEHEEGKTMGLAPYGNQEWYNSIRDLVDYDEEGNFTLSTLNILKMIHMKEEIQSMENSDKRCKVCADIAWAGQHILEEVYVDIARYLQKETQCKNLCIAGGVALNSVGNYKIYKKHLYDQIFIQPASGDDGIAIGAAYYGYYT